jgi:hypothetical protein
MLFRKSILVLSLVLSSMATSCTTRYQDMLRERDERIRERMTDAARIFWRMCEPLAAAAGSEDPERDGRGMAAMVDGLLLDRLAHPGQTHELLVEAVARITTPR